MISENGMAVVPQVLCKRVTEGGVLIDQQDGDLSAG